MFINLLWFIISLGVKQAQIKVAIPPGIIPDGCVKADNETDQVFFGNKNRSDLVFIGPFGQHFKRYRRD